jgi:hypothetical protein
VLDDAATRLDNLRAGIEAAEMTIVASAFHPGARESPPHPDYERDNAEPWAEVYRSLREIYRQTEDLTALVPRLRIRFLDHEPVVHLYEQATVVARRHPFSVDFVEEGATLDSAGRRLAEISAALGSIRAEWDSRAIALARFSVSAADGGHGDQA